MNFDALNKTPDRVRYVSVSEMHDFLTCQWRWYAKWVLNRVPRRWSAALILGTAVHDIFEGHFGNAQPLDKEHAFQVAVLEERLHSPRDPAEVVAVSQALKDLKKYYAQIVGFVDKYKIDEVLEVEKAFVLHLHTPKFTWQSDSGTPRAWVLRGRPDRVVLVGGFVYHMQHKTVAQGKSPHLYTQVLQRSMHEGLYGYYLASQYGDRAYGGTIVNLIRKAVLKAGASPESLGFQAMVGVDEIDRERAFQRAKALASEMDRAEYFGRAKGIWSLIDNPQVDDGYFHNSLDGYFHALQGKVSLDDDAYFMPREETYGQETD